jgi:hypothetical protein
MINLMVEIIPFFPSQKTRKAPIHSEGMLMLLSHSRHCGCVMGRGQIQSSDSTCRKGEKQRTDDIFEPSRTMLKEVSHHLRLV